MPSYMSRYHSTAERGWGSGVGHGSPEIMETPHRINITDGFCFYFMIENSKRLNMF